MSQHLVVVGGGQSAAQAIQTLRQQGFDGDIGLVASEPELPYQRPPLSKKYLAGTMPADRLQLKSEGFYESRNVELMLGTAVDAIDRRRRELALDDGRRLPYSQLVIATGSRVRRLDVPGVGLPGVHYLRTIADVDAIAPQFLPGRRLVVVGAGYIGLEVAAVAASAGLDVTVLEASDRVLSRVVCPEMSGFLAAYHSQHGVRIECGIAVERFEGREHVRQAVTQGGRRFECDLVIIGIGIVPNVEVAAAAGLTCDNGIRVDACARTEDPAVVAAGDCTNQPHPFVGRRVRLESVHNAIEQGKSAALACLGEARPFDEVPWFWSDQYDLKLQIAGLPLDYDEIVVRGEIESRQFAFYYLSRGRTIAVEAVNSPKEFITARRLLPQRPLFPVEAIRDPHTDLAALLASD